MLRTGLVLLLLCAATPALASQPGGTLTPLTTTDGDPDATAPNAAGAAGEKSKTLLSPSTGGGDDDATLPRVRGPKWHRLLPGMFR